jgi:hypothetical protein
VYKINVRKPTKLMNEIKELHKWSRALWLTLVILATQEAEVRKIVVQS